VCCRNYEPLSRIKHLLHRLPQGSRVQPELKKKLSYMEHKVNNAHSEGVA